MNRSAAVTQMLILFLGELLGFPSLTSAAPAVTTTEGVVTTIDTSSVTVSPRAGGTARIMVTADTRIIRRQTARFDQIKPREFVGVAAKRVTDGSLTAVSINIFPPEFKGRIREAQFPMETGNVMTNAVVFQNVRRIDGRTLYLQFPEGTAVINVPRDAEIFRLTLMKLGDLKTGMRIVVRGGGNPDGSITAGTITFDESGR
ncbi:MAG: DUF5666 domain-containing protein [Armatimonadota bacterium]